MRDQLENFDERELVRTEAIIQSMTPLERDNPKVLNGSRRARIAKGAGRPVSEVNKLLDQFRQMQKMMKQLGAGGGGGRMGMPPGMMGGLR